MRSLPRFSALCCILASALTAPACADAFDVYILAGQSNAGGHGYVDRAHAWFSPQGDDGLVELGRQRYLETQPGVIFNHWRGGTPKTGRTALWDARTVGWIPLRAGYSLFNYADNAPDNLGAETPNHPFGAEVTFAERIREGRPQRQVAVIKYTQGATSLGTATSPGAWDPAAGRAYQLNAPANPGHCYAGLLQLVRESLDQLSAQGHTHTLRGFLWHQGESDAGLATSVYKERLKEFIAAIRTDLGKPDLPFLIGELLQQSAYANARNAQQQAAAETPNAAFISSVGFKGDSTTIHLDTLAQLDLGRRFAERMLQFGPVMRRTSAHWQLNEPSLTWNGSNWTGITDTVSGTEGVLYGYAQTDQSAVESIVNRPGPDDNDDRGIDFSPDPGISGVNTLRPDALPARGDFTLLVTMRTQDPHASQGHLFSNNNGQAGRCSIHLQAGALTWFHNGGVTLTENASPVFDGQWHVVGVIRKGNSWRLIRDGLTVATGESTGTISQNTEWMIGRMRAYNGNFEGEISDVRILNHALSDPLEIQSFQFTPREACAITFSSQPGFEYALEWSADLLAWNPLRIATASADDRTTEHFTDPSLAGQLFIRLR